MADTTLPAIFDPLLDFLSDKLPPTAFGIVQSLLEHSFALTSSLITLIYQLITSPSTVWDAEKILPPLITLLAAYLALVSFYRTTGWMIRTAFAFVKWGFILTTLGAAAGYILANGAGGAAGNGMSAFSGGLLPAIGGYVLDWLSGNASSDTSRSKSKTQTSRKTRQSKSKSQSQSRPNAWDSWDQHRDWQYRADARDGRDPAAEVQRVVGEVLGAASKAVTESGWWEAAKGAVNDYQTQAEEARKKRQQSSKSR